MNLYVVRHGRTNHNEMGLFNGRTDEDINDTGVEQAKYLRDQISNIDIDLIICSPMKRARHTAEIINCKNVPVIYDERLIERDTGEITLRPSHTVDREAYWNYYSTKYKNVERIPDLFKRVHSSLDDIKEKYKDKNILIVTHNGVSRAIYMYFNELPENGVILDVGTQENCEIKKYKLK